MSVVRNAMRSLRIVALPMTKPKFHFPESTMQSKPFVDRMLVYYHFSLISPGVEKKQSGLLNSLTAKAVDTWAGFGKAPKGSWKVRETSATAHILLMVQR